MIFPAILGIIGLSLPSKRVPFDDREIKELKVSYNSKPLNLLKLENLNNIENTFPLFGGYKGLEGVIIVIIHLMIYVHLTLG